MQFKKVQQQESELQSNSPYPSPILPNYELACHGSEVARSLVILVMGRTEIHSVAELF